MLINPYFIKSKLGFVHQLGDIVTFPSIDLEIQTSKSFEDTDEVLDEHDKLINYES